MSDATTKRPYARPEILRVRLNPEQAVLSQCSVSTTKLSGANPPMGCNPAKDCRQWKDLNSADFTFSS